MPEIPYPPPVSNKAPKPPGILPRNAQNWVIGGIALVMVLVIAFSSGKDPQGRTPPALTPNNSAPDETRIQEYRERIDQQVQRLAAEQARLTHARQSVEALSASRPSLAGAPETGEDHASSVAGETGGGKSWIEQDRERRAYESRYASNVALSRRAPLKPGSDDRTEVDGRRATVTAGKNSVTASISPDLQEATGKLYRVFEGAVIETVLTNRLDGYFSGPINCLVTTNVFSHDRSKLLIPQGTRALGNVSRVETQGQERLAVAFHRLLMPDGYSVGLEKLPGLNQLGETGLLDQVNHHYFQIFGVSIAIGAIAGLSQANTRYGANATPADAYRQGVATSLSQSSLNILDRYLNVLPTVTIREGHRVKLYLTADLLLPAYDNHRLAADL